MEAKEIADQLDGVKKAVETSVETKATKLIEEKAAELTKSVDDFKTSTAKQIEDLKEIAVGTQKGFDDYQIANKATKAENKTVSFKSALGEALDKNKEALANYAKDRRAVNLELKTVGNMVAGNLTTSGTVSFAGAEMVGGVGRKPYESVHVRNIPGINIVPTSSDQVYVIRDAAGEGAPTAVGMGVIKPQSDRDYVKLIVPVTKIAHYFKIPEEMLTDNAWLQNEITAIGVEDLLAVEDGLLLNQASGAGLFAGLTTSTNSTAFSAPTALALGVNLANRYDVLVAAWTQLRTLNNSATAILVNPQDYAQMILTKEATTGAYVYGTPNAVIPNVLGIPVISSNVIAVDKFLIGDFSKVTIGQRAGVSVRFYDQNEDDAIKNMVTVVIEERLTVVADRADRLVYGDFTDAMALLETA